MNQPPQSALFGLPGAEEALCLGPAHASRRLVLLHGWGADADVLLNLGEALVDDPDATDVSLVALRAPLPHPGGSGRQWYDLLPAPAWEQLPEARSALRQRLLALATSVPLERTALLGFSQGAAMALDVALDVGTHDAGPLPLAALIACSGYPHPDWHPGRSATRILLTHGEQDPMVAPGASEEVERALKAAGGSVKRLTFPGGHGIDPALLPSLRAFLEEGWAD
ncbi:esterase [Cyanobium sp. FGCU-52]|nr:esterase [Cyanobium sp. FGCU52]